MCPSGAYELTVVNDLLMSIDFLMNAFIPEAPIEENIASECICTISPNIWL